MHTLQDFLLVTKAETYLIAVAFVVTFPLFWRWLNTPAAGRAAKPGATRTSVLLLAVLAAGLSLPAGDAVAQHSGSSREAVCTDCHTCKAPSRSEPCLNLCPRSKAAKDIQQAPAYITLNELEYEYYEVVFNHRLHAEMSAMSGNCGECHHYSTGRKIGACSECHPVGEVSNMSVPSLKAAYHRQCMNCHSQWSGVTSCEMCHIKKAVPAPPTDQPTHIAMTPSRRFFPGVDEPEKKVWNSTYGGGTVVTFFHRAHTENYGIDCATCHHAEGCASCHRKGTTTQRIRHSEEALHAICNSCHSEMSCQQCHLKSEAAPFTHARTGWPLTAYHASAACRDCHGDPRHFEKPSKNCNACHSHWTPATFDHARAGIELNDVHRDIDCAACHNGRAFDKSPNCSACHDSDFAYPAKIPGNPVHRKS